MLHHKNTSILITSSSSSPVMKCQHKNTPDYPDCRESGTNCFSIRQPEKLEPPWQEFLMIIQTIPFICTGSIHYTGKSISLSKHNSYFVSEAPVSRSFWKLYATGLSGANNAMTVNVHITLNDRDINSVLLIFHVVSRRLFWIFTSRIINGINVSIIISDCTLLNTLPSNTVKVTGRCKLWCFWKGR